MGGKRVSTHPSESHTDATGEYSGGVLLRLVSCAYQREKKYAFQAVSGRGFIGFSAKKGPDSLSTIPAKQCIPESLK